MSINVYNPHVLVLPEDRANQSIANGFLLNINPQKTRCIQILRHSGGYLKVLSDFKNVYINHLTKYPLGHLIMLIDFDNDFTARSAFFKNEIPNDIVDRVYLLGSLEEPETLKRIVSKNYEDIGKTLATECHQNTSILWSNSHLQDNTSERQRLNGLVKSILF